MRADMGGAATVCSAIVTAAALKLPINIIGVSVAQDHFIGFVLVNGATCFNIMFLLRFGTAV